MGLDLTTLLAQANCVQCLPAGQQQLAELVLLSQIASDGIVVSSASFQRPADSIPYSVGDEVSNSVSPNPQAASNPTLSQMLVFPNAAPFAGGAGVIKRAVMFTNDQAYGGKTFALNLFTVRAPTFGDNNPFNMSFANRVGHLGPAITFPMQTQAGSIYGAGATEFIAMQMPLTIPFVCGPSDTNLYGILTIGTATTPVPNSTFAVDLYIGLQ